MSIVMSVNAGSSSLKFQVFKMPEEEVLAQGTYWFKRFYLWNESQWRKN